MLREGSKNYSRWVKLLGAVFILTQISWSEDTGIKLDTPHFGIFSTLGMLQGDTVEAEGNSGLLEKKGFTRWGAWVNLNASIKDRTEVSLLLAALRWNSLPLTKGSVFTKNQLLSPGLGHAYLSHKFGNPDSPFLKLTFGDMQYRYSDAKNLGGHLYTGGTYPGSLTGNYWQLIDGNYYNGQGLLASFNFLNNALSVDLTAFIEHGMEPHLNLTPGIVTSYRVGDVFEIGAGAVFSHLISVDDDFTTPERRDNAYYNGAPLSVAEQRRPGLEVSDTLVISPGASNDSLIGRSLPSTDPRFAELTSKAIIPKYYSVAENGVPNSQLEYYTFQGVKLMGRFSLTPLAPFGEGLNRPSFFAEATLLGYKDYPFYYEKKSERMPVLAGINVPLPGFELGIEVEHYKNKFRNHIKNVYEDGLPTWEDTPVDFTQEVDLGGGVMDTIPAEVHDYGEFFWSVTAKKQVLGYITFNFRLSRDYLRTINFFGNPSYEQAFKQQKSWYMVFKTELNI